MEKSDAGASRQKAQYEKPRLVSYGDLQTITRGATGNMADGGGSTHMCWVAEAVYGETNPRTQLLRSWLVNIYAFSPRGRFVVMIYRSTGRQIARIARRSLWLRNALRPMLDAGLRRAQQHYMRAA